MLKNKTKSDDDLCKIAVAPFVGAWIETYAYSADMAEAEGRSFRRSVD